MDFEQIIIYFFKRIAVRSVRTHLIMSFLITIKRNLKIAYTIII